MVHKRGFLVLTDMPRPVLGESCTTSLKDFALFPPHQKIKKKIKNPFTADDVCTRHEGKFLMNSRISLKICTKKLFVSLNMNLRWEMKIQYGDQKTIVLPPYLASECSIRLFATPECAAWRHMVEELRNSL